MSVLPTRSTSITRALQGAGVGRGYADPKYNTVQSCTVAGTISLAMTVDGTVSVPDSQDLDF